MTDSPARTRANNQKRLLELAGAYKGMSRRELAQVLGRDASKLVLASGNPKLDYVIKLAELLDWNVEDVVDAIWAEDRPVVPAEAVTSFEELDQAALAAHRAGEYQRMRQLAKMMAEVATTPEQRALACLREGGAWDGLGQFSRELEAMRRGLQEGGTSMELRLLLQANLANSYYTLNHLLEARGMAREIIEMIAQSSQESRRVRAARAFAHYVLGHACRRLAGQENEGMKECATSGRSALATSKEQYEELAEQYDHAPWRGIARNCHGGLLELDVLLELLSPEEALDEIHEGVDSVRAEGADLRGDELECYGWWCIFGCNISLRHTVGRTQQQYLASLIEQGCEIANKLNNWTMRERLYSMQLERRQRLNDLAGVEVEWTINGDDVRRLVGTMGRFPAFRSVGWRILRQAAVV